MTGVTRRVLGAGTVAALVALVAGVAGAAVPPGPRLAFVAFGEGPVRLELLSVDPSGTGFQQIAGGSIHARPLPLPDTPSWSPDGSSIAFTGLASRKAHAKGVHQIYVATAGGGDPRPVPGTAGGFRPVFAPDGHTIAFQRVRERTRKNRRGGREVLYLSASIWLADLNGGPPRRLTPWRNGLDYAPDSFSPDGTELAATRRTARGAPPELVAINLIDGGVAILAHEAADGIYSPDGSRIAYLLVFDRTVRHGRRAGTQEETTDLYTMSADGTDPRQITHTTGSAEVWPGWDPSGQRLVVTQIATNHGEAGRHGFGDAIVEMNADGSCATNVLSAHSGVALYGATWQPGPGRAAGPISC
jgi:Tol biopolymer transport system component